MAATQAETPQSDANAEQNLSEQHGESRTTLLQNGTDKNVNRAPSADGVTGAKVKTSNSEQYRPGEEPPDRPPPEQYGQYRYDGGDPYGYAARPGFQGKVPRPPPGRYFPGQTGAQPPTPTLNSLLQSSGAPGPHRYPNNYEQPPGPYGPGGWGQPRAPIGPYNPQPYRNAPPGPGGNGPPRAGSPGGYGYAPTGVPATQQPPPTGYPPGSYPQRYPPPGPPPPQPGARPPYPPHQGYERGGPSPQPSPGAPPPPSPGSQQPALSPQPPQSPHAATHQPHQQAYPPPQRPGQPTTPNAHEPEPDLTGGNSNDSSGGSGGGGTRATTPHLRPTPSPTGSSGSRSMSPAIGQQSVPMAPRPSAVESSPVRPPYQQGGPAPHHPAYKPYPVPPYPPYGPRPYGPPHAPHGAQYQYRPPVPYRAPRPDGAMPPPDAPHDNGPATALVTTGPDGAPIDDGSQQSTLSNTSAASGDDGQGSGGAPTPKGRKDGGYVSASPHDDYEGAASPWPRPPSSPKCDSVGKLYEMDERPERRAWVERLLAFMEDKRTPITACPTISKQPLDLYRLYLLVQERGGFLEVNKVAKNKLWKDIASQLNIGASSSAAYTLRKHYTKNLLAYECHFDRGGIDPQPIINQIEASTKKKGNKANSSPNAGTSGAAETGNDYGYQGYPPQQMHNAHEGDNMAAANPFDDRAHHHRPGYQQGYSYEGYGNQYPPPNRAVYPPYGPGPGGPDQERGYSGQPVNQTTAYASPAASPAPAPPATHPTPPAPYPPAQPRYAPPPPSGPQAPPPPHHYPDYYRTQHHETQTGQSSSVNIMNSQLARQLVAPLSPGNKNYHHQYGANKGPPPGTPPGPRRHPDFVPGKESPRPAAPYSPYLRPGYGPPPNWRPHQWGQPYQPQSAGVNSAPTTTTTTAAAPVLKREVTFPPDSVEATTPAPDKRRRLTRADVSPVDAWRLMMALKSGLLAETCWALDVLNILLHDDSCVGYFGLQHMPGLLDLLLEHFQKALGAVLEKSHTATSSSHPWYQPPTVAARATPDLGAVSRPPPPEARRTLINGRNYTMESRRCRPVVLKPRDDDIFVMDGQRDWDEDGERVEETALEPWHFASDAPHSDHIVPCFRAEFLHLPFARVLPSAPPRPASAPPSIKTPNDLDEDNLESEPMELERSHPPTPEPEKSRSRIQIRDPSASLKRRRMEDYEEECQTRDEPSLNLVDETRERLAHRCLAISNILRGLTFVPGNETEFSRSSSFLAICGKLLLLHHEHAPRASRARAYERAGCDKSDSAETEEEEESSMWWWDTLARLREDALVCCANVGGYAELSTQPEAVARPLLDGLLHWAVCPAAAAEDALPTQAALSPRRLALEALCKLCVMEGNVDLVLATPPRWRLHALCNALARDLCSPDERVLREFAVNLLHYLAAASSGVSRAVCLATPAVAQLVAFVERAEAAALAVANAHGVAALRDNPDAMGTSLDMLRRAASTLATLARHPDNRATLLRHEQRLLSLVMSQILDQKVASELSKVLFLCSRSPRSDDDD